MRTRIAVLICILFSAIAPSTGQQKLVIKEPRTRADVAQSIDDIQNDLTTLNRHHENYRQEAEKLSNLYSDLNKKMDGLIRTVNAVAAGLGSASSSAQLLAATKQMQETQMSFNLQYLQLQEQMQNENREYTVVSNIMKTKQDTVKNSIHNIR